MLALTVAGNPDGETTPAAARHAALKATLHWDAPLRIVHTAATVEIDTMPFLARDAGEGGPFRSYYEAVQDLGADYVRFAEWGCSSQR